MPLPSNCAACVFFEKDGSLCRRHAPGPGYEEMEVAHWPVVKATDRCGSGEMIADGTASPTNCAECLHWVQSKDRPFNPITMREMNGNWWRESGVCSRFPPSPSSEERRETWWRLTNGKTDKCGDGTEVGKST